MNDLPRVPMQQNSLGRGNGGSIDVFLLLRIRRHLVSFGNHTTNTSRSSSPFRSPSSSSSVARPFTRLIFAAFFSAGASSGSAPICGGAGSRQSVEATSGSIWCWRCMEATSGGPAPNGSILLGNETLGTFLTGVPPLLLIVGAGLGGGAAGWGGSVAGLSGAIVSFGCSRRRGLRSSDGRHFLSVPLHLCPLPSLSLLCPRFSALCQGRV